MRGNYNLIVCTYGLLLAVLYGLLGRGGEAYGILHISLYYSGIELMITPNLYTSNYLPRSIY